MAGLQLIPRVTVNAFFDRAAVKNALTKAEYHAFSRAGLLVRRTAKESIKKKGLARPQLKVMKTYPGLDLTSLSRLLDGPRSSGGFIRKQEPSAGIPGQDLPRPKRHEDHRNLRLPNQF
jgi:hypothetical protein